MIINEGINCFFIGNIESPDAIVKFEENEDIIILFVFVTSKLRGQGIAKQLVDRVVEYADDKKKKIIPVCSYAKKVLSDSKYQKIVSNVKKH